MRKKIISPYESHNRTAICALCKEVKDEKAVKIFKYWGKHTGHELYINVCRSCENKKQELEDLVKKHLKREQDAQSN